jgi:hypothetical protein
MTVHAQRRRAGRAVIPRQSALRDDRGIWQQRREAARSLAALGMTSYARAIGLGAPA